jgi:hypothetical protein
MKAFKIRCSAIGKIMTNPRTKGELLSQTAKTYIEEEVLRAKYGIIKTFSSRYTDKGNLVEDEAIEMASNALELGFLYKNHEHFRKRLLDGNPGRKHERHTFRRKKFLGRYYVSVFCYGNTYQRLLFSVARLP